MHHLNYFHNKTKNTISKVKGEVDWRHHYFFIINDVIPSFYFMDISTFKYNNNILR